MSKFINADPDLFQSTLPRRERQVIGFISGATDICFNPRSHEGSDETSRIHGRRLRVSIHAPTKGATFMEKYGKQGVKLFQSTLPRRERLIRDLAILHKRRVSIHAPTKGATVLWTGSLAGWTCFNPRSHEGSDDLRYRTRPERKCFNPRSHEGSDLPSGPQYGPGGSFNPRSHEGSDGNHLTALYRL